MTQPLHFIIIDDDPSNNTISRIIIKRSIGQAEVLAYTNPEEGFLFISNEFPSTGNTAILLLDINMPVMTGWDFLERFATLDSTLKERIKIYMVSSSLDERDKQRALANTHVSDYITKPLTLESMKRIFDISAA